MISPSHFAARAGTADDLRAAFAPTLAAAKGDGSDPKASRPYARDPLTRLLTLTLTLTPNVTITLSPDPDLHPIP